MFSKSTKLDNVLYDVRGPVVDEAAKMEAKGTPLAEPAGCLSGDCAHCGASCPSAKAAQAAVAPNTTEGGDK